MSKWTRTFREKRSARRSCGEADPSGGRATPRWRCRRLSHGAIGLALALAFSGATLGPILAQNVRVLNLPTNDIIYDPVSQRIFVSVPSIVGPGLGNSITAIDPVTGAIESSVFVGSEPGPLAISNDGQFIYVGLFGARAIRRYDIATATAGLQFSLGVDPRYGQYFAEDIEVLPGAPHSVAVSRTRNLIPRHAGVAVFDDGVMRPNTTQVHIGSNRIEFSDSASLLFGMDNESTGGATALREISITPDGATETAAHARFIEGNFRGDIEYEQGVLYVTSGHAYDPSTLTIVGTYDSHGPVEMDPVQGNVFFVETDTFGDTTLKRFDLTTFLLQDSIPLAGVSGVARSAARWGPDAVAFNTSGGQLFLISGIPLTLRKPTCTVDLNQDVYTDGDTVVATSLRLGNPTVKAISVEARLWFDRPDEDPFPMPGILPSGAIDLPPGTDKELGPITLATVTTGLPRGRYSFDCRLVDPVTADYRALDENEFELQ